MSNALNRKFCWSSRNANLIQQKTVLGRNLCVTYDTQKIKLRIGKNTRLAGRRSFGLVATAEVGVPRCGRDALHTGFYCAPKRRSMLTFLQPFEQRNVLFREAYGRSLRVIDKSYAMVGVLSQDACGTDDVLIEDGSDIG